MISSNSQNSYEPQVRSASLNAGVFKHRSCLTIQKICCVLDVAFIKQQCGKHLLSTNRIEFGVMYCTSSNFYDGLSALLSAPQDF